MKNIIIGCDHAGFELKEFLKNYLESEGYELETCGADSDTPYDYPDVASQVAKYVKTNKDTLGIIICGTGIGMSIAVNRYKGIRGALLYSPISGILAKEHNNANVVVLGARTFSNKENLDFLNAFLGASFTNEEKHQRRINKIDTNLEN